MRLLQLVLRRSSAFLPNAQGHYRGLKTSSNNNLEEIIMKISSKGTQTRAAVASLINAGASKPYRLTGEDMEWSENYTMKPLDRELKRKQLWIECHKAWQAKSEVDGSILNVVKGGYAVSIAGFIAFMPRSLRKTSNIHSKFVIHNIRSDNNNLIVEETVGSAMTWSKLFRFYKRSLQRLDIVVWIKGTVVALAKDGYCVAVAGHLAFLPKANRKSRKLESTFRITTMYPRTGKIVLQEVNTKYFASLAPQDVGSSESESSKEGDEEDGLEGTGS